MPSSTTARLLERGTGARKRATRRRRHGTPPGRGDTARPLMQREVLQAFLSFRALLHDAQFFSFGLDQLRHIKHEWHGTTDGLTHGDRAAERQGR